MNLSTICAILGASASIVAILAYFDDGINKNKARLRAGNGRVTSLATITEIQGQRITALENFYAINLTDESDNFFQPNEPLIELERSAREEYKKHHTDLT